MNSHIMWAVVLTALYFPTGGTTLIAQNNKANEQQQKSKYDIYRRTISISCDFCRENVFLRDSTSTSNHPGEDEFVAVEKEVGFDYSEISSNVVYPSDALRWGIEGKVMVALLIGKCGNVHEAKIIESDNKLLNKAALTALLETTFTPAVVDNKPVTSWVRVPIDFKLRDKPSK